MWLIKIKGVGEIGVCKMEVGKMGLGEMGPTLNDLDNLTFAI